MCLVISPRNTEKFLITISEYKFNKKNWHKDRFLNRRFGIKTFLCDCIGKRHRKLTSPNYDFAYKFERGKAIPANSKQDVLFEVPTQFGNSHPARTTINSRMELGYHISLASIEGFVRAFNETILFKRHDYPYRKFSPTTLIVELRNVQIYNGLNDIVVESFSIPTIRELRVIRKVLEEEIVKREFDSLLSMLKEV